MTTATEGAVLHVRVGEHWQAQAARARSVMKALEAGTRVAPQFGVGFADMGHAMSVFTQRRWELLTELRSGGPMTVAELARRLQRDYKNVHTDVAALVEWMAIERTEEGAIRVPWSEIVVDLKLPQPLAA